MKNTLLSAFILATVLAASAWGSPESGAFLGRIGVTTRISNADMLAKNGYSYIEEGVVHFLMPDKSEAEFEEMLRTSRDAAIPVKACNLFLPGTLKCVGPDAAHADILEYSQTVFRRAEKAGVEFIVFGSGGARRVPDGFSVEEARRQFVDLCGKLGPLAAQHHVVLVLEPLHKGQCNLINRVSEGGKIVEEVNHPNFRLLADFYHMLMENEGPESIETYGHLIHHAHIAEKEGRAAPGTHGEDFTPYFQALKNAGYKGLLSIEAKWDGMEKQAGHARETIRVQAANVN